MKKLLSITNEQYFNSIRYIKMLQSIARGSTGLYFLQVKKSKHTSTNGNTIYINTFHQFVEQLPMSEIALYNIGNLAHEIFHVLYTDFSVLKIIRTDSRRNPIVMKQILNIIEDSAVELLGTNEFPGSFREGIIFNNEICYANAVNAEDKATEFEQLVHCIMNFSILGRIKGNISKLSRKVQDCFAECLPIIRESRFAENTWGRYESAKLLYDKLKPFMQQNIDYEILKDMYFKPTLLGTGKPQKCDVNPVIVNDFHCSEDFITNNADNTTCERQDVLESIQYQISNSKKAEEQDQYIRNDELKQDVQTQEDANNLDYGNLHKNMDIKIINSPSLEYEDEYKKLRDGLKQDIRSMKRRLSDIKSLKKTGKIRNQYDGKFNVSELYKQDLKICYKSAKQEKNEGYALSLVIDESASMDDAVEDLTLIHYARNASIMFAEACEELGFAYSINGHTAKFCEDQVVVHQYVKFNDINKNARYSLAGIRTYENTREGMSLNFCLNELAKQKTKNKVLFVLSDGNPSHRSKNGKYENEIAIKDVHSVVKKYKGITVVGIALGDDEILYRDLSKIYPKTIKVPNVSDLPKKLVNMILTISR